jgi:hypothetical protein
MGEDEGVGADAVLGRQAPDGVAVALAVAAEIQRGGRAFVVLGAVEVEVEVQRLLGGQRQVVVEVGVIALVQVLDVGVVQRQAQIVVDHVATAEHVDALETIGVARCRFQLISRNLKSLFFCKKYFT